MNFKMLFSTPFFLIAVFAFRNDKFIIYEKPKEFFQYDTSNAKLREFKVFTKNFFSAVKSSDTAFLKAHVIFPISNSSFYIFDKSLLHKKIDSKTLFKRLDKLFPVDLVKKIDKEGKFAYLVSKNALKKFVIDIYDTSGEIEGNYTWVFVQKNNNFYFVNFRSEAG